jgi:hypothetical protein
MALPMVLWAIALLAGVTILLAGVINSWVEEETRAGKSFRARQMALSGLALAMNGSVAPGDPVLNGGNEEEGWRVVIGDESGLINPNVLLSAKPDHRDLLGELFNAWKLPPDASETAADGLYDWQSTVPFRSPRGAKQADYEAAGFAGLPPGAPFVSPEEMELVIGFDPVRTAKPDWKGYFSTYNPGGVNLMHAPRSILIDLFQLTPAQADAWIALRNGKDGIEGTDDDVNPGTLDRAMTLIGAAGSQRSLIGAAACLGGSLRRIESTGYCHGVKRRIVVVTGASQGNNPQPSSSMLGWSEE